MDTERIGHLIEKFREEHPDVPADVLMEFAQHVRRVSLDDLREEVKTGSVPVKLSLQVNGNAFSAQGPRYFVEELLDRWQERQDRRASGLPPGGFNRMKLISGTGR